jgi:methyl-accepting chemotaxis protein
MHPNGLFLLVVGLCSFAVVCVAAGFLAVKAWRLLKRGIRISRVAGPLAADLAMRAEQLAKLSDDMAQQTEQVAASIYRLEASTRRLQVVLRAFSESLVPYRRVKDYFGLW